MTKEKLIQELKNEREALRNVLRQQRDERKWIRWADKRITKLEKQVIKGK